MDDPKFLKLKETLDFFDKTHLTTEDFMKAFDLVLKAVENIKKSSEREFELIHRAISALLDRSRRDVGVDVSQFKDQINASVKEQLANNANERDQITDEINNRITSLVNEKESEKSKLTTDILSQVPTKLIQEIKSELETLKKNQEDIIEVKAELVRVKDVLANIPRGKAMGRAKVPRIRSQNLTSQVDGVTSTFTLAPDTTAILGIFGTQFPINFNADVDWRFEGRTLILVTDQVATPQAGQTLWALTEVLFYP